MGLDRNCSGASAVSCNHRGALPVCKRMQDELHVPIYFSGALWMRPYKRGVFIYFLCVCWKKAAYEHDCCFLGWIRIPSIGRGVGETLPWTKNGKKFVLAEANYILAERLRRWRFSLPFFGFEWKRNLTVWAPALSPADSLTLDTGCF